MEQVSIKDAAHSSVQQRISPSPAPEEFSRIMTTNTPPDPKAPVATTTGIDDATAAAPTWPSREDVERLKSDWLIDPCWDLGRSEGFEDYWDELKAFAAAHWARCSN